MASAIFMPFRAQSTFMAECRSADTSIVSRFILGVIAEAPERSRMVESLFGAASYFIISDNTTVRRRLSTGRPAGGRLQCSASRSCQPRARVRVRAASSNTLAHDSQSTAARRVGGGAPGGAVGSAAAGGGGVSATQAAADDRRAVPQGVCGRARWRRGTGRLGRRRLLHLPSLALPAAPELGISEWWALDARRRRVIECWRWPPRSYAVPVPATATPAPASNRDLFPGRLSPPPPAGAASHSPS